ncbi:MAG: HlyC/CorC family transporter [Clostridia bacterium]|nr:HlyC/CorC family transporter [Clostridia bacterium]
MSYVLIAVLICFSAFFSGSEIAYTSLNKLRVKKEAEQGNKLSKMVVYICDHYQNILSTILIGNNLVNIAATSVAAVIALQVADRFGMDDGTAATVVTLIMTILILIFGEISPKVISARKNEAISKFAAYPLLILMVVFYPLVFLSTGITKALSFIWRRHDEEEDVTITEEEFATILETVEDEGVLDEDQTELLQSALEFPDLNAEDILTPRIDMVSFDINAPLDKVLEVIAETQFSRIPVYEETIDHIIGVLHVNSLYKELVDNPNASIREMLMEVVYLPQTMKLPAILEELRKRQTHMAIVTDEYGGTMGLLTMEDVLEQLVGEIWDETDEIVDEFTKISDDRYECSGQMNIADFLDELELDDRDFESEATTVGDWAAEMIGSMPEVFDAFHFRRLTVIVKEVEGNRVTRLIVLIRPQVEETE